MISVESSVLIDRHVDDAWAFVSNPRNESTWHTDILEVRRTAPGSESAESWMPGEDFFVTVQFMGRKEYAAEITGFERGRRLEFTTREGPFRPIATYLLEPVNGATRFTRHVDMPTPGLLRLMTPLMRRDLAKRNARFAHNLKQLLEQ